MPAASSAAAVLKSIPFFAATPLPTIIATGVASPSAQGQLITRTEIARARENPASFPKAHHTKNVSTATKITTGTKTALTLSAMRAEGAFVAAASLTIFIIWLSVVSFPTRSARHFKNPFILTDAEITKSPGFLSTGMLSPVTAASFTAPVPSITVPSTATLSPG